MESSDRRSRYERSRSISSARDRSRSRPRALSFSRSPSPRGRRPTQRSRSLGRSISSSSFSPSSRSRSRNRSSRSRRSRNHSDKKTEEKTGALAAIKSAAPLLATIGVASVVAHKFWPKGVLFGDKEDWETRKVVERRARTIEKDEDGGIRRARHVRQKEGGELVVDDYMRKPKRRDPSADWAYERGTRRPSSYYADDRQYAQLPPARSQYDDRERAYWEERPRPRHVEGYNDSRYDDRRYQERSSRPKSFMDDRGYDARDQSHW